jgi:dolichyl-diphosphooligosaccharide--protein glycosyltransferase/undecaprenyl-diphosphooligosaccharide--protein glycosyltransferase
MVGYYDSDMFSVLLQFSIFYSLLYIIYKKNLEGIILASILIILSPYFYPQGTSITYAMFLISIVYLFAEYKGFIIGKETKNFQENDKYIYKVLILLTIAMMNSIPEMWRVVIFVTTLIVLSKKDFTSKEYIVISLIIFVLFLYFGNALNSMVGSLKLYLQRGVEDTKNLHFYQVIQTVREAGAIPFSTIADRISGSMFGLILSAIGFLVLIFKHKPFIVALPLIGIGFFAYIGGLRFTVYAVPIAAISVVYLFWVIADNLLKDNKIIKYSAVVIGVIAILYPNIQHIIAYKTPTVLNSQEVADLKKLDKVSSRKDYTLAWWDYGFPLWYYSNTSTLIDGGKHQNDNYIVSKMMLSQSPELTASLGRLAIETYVDNNYSNVANTLFSKKNLDPDILLTSLKSGDYKLPTKTREVYIYFPYRMLGIFPTISLFGNIDLNTGKQLRDIVFYPTTLKSKTDGGILTFQNGIIFDMKKGLVQIGNSQQGTQYFIITENTSNGDIKVNGQKYNNSSNLVVIFMKSYNKFILLDTQTFNSSFVQMFILGKYDKNLFELITASIYSRIYRIKK